MLSRAPRSTSATGVLYDERYAGDYMDSDAYSVWGHGDLRSRQVMETLKLAGIRPRTLLDYGCGVGGWIGFLSSTYPDAQIAGVDISSVAIEKARKRFPNLRFETFGGAATPFANEEFDLVFSYHVLEHVDDIEASAAEIARVLRYGGYAVIIFPCGNVGSFLDRTMGRLKDARVPAPDGRSVLFFEVADGHVRRMTSRDTVAIFEACRLQAVAQLFSGHFFGTVDWLCRGTGPAYINKVFAGRPATGRIAKLRLEATRRTLLAIHRLIGKNSLDLTRRRNPLKQVAVYVVKWFATLTERTLSQLSALEWRLRKHDERGTAQYLVFRKDAPKPTSKM